VSLRDLHPSLLKPSLQELDINIIILQFMKVWIELIELLL